LGVGVGPQQVFDNAVKTSDIRPLRALKGPFL
jgi:hypothetical protein